MTGKMGVQSAVEDDTSATRMGSGGSWTFFDLGREARYLVERGD